MGKAATLTDEQVETIRATYAMTGKYSEAAKAAGVSIASARKYVLLSDDLEDLRTEKRREVIEATIPEVIAAFSRAQLALVEALTDADKLAKATVNEIAVAIGIVTDKRQLLSGQATDRREHVSADVASRLTAEEMEQAAKIRERLAAQVSA